MKLHVILVTVSQENLYVCSTLFVSMYYVCLLLAIYVLYEYLLHKKVKLAPILASSFPLKAQDEMKTELTLH